MVKDKQKQNRHEAEREEKGGNEERRGWKIAIGREGGGNLHLAQTVPPISSIPSRYYARGTLE